MTTYRNLEGNSGILAYEIGSDYIDVQFKGGKVYRYTDASAGSNNIETMKGLAQAGHGLNTFISKNVKERYASKSH
jgi:hypothetical protein